VDIWAWFILHPAAFIHLFALRRIVAAACPRTATADPPYALGAAFTRPVLLYGFDEVFTATGMITAYLREHWPDYNLIKSDRHNQRNTEEPAQQVQAFSEHWHFSRHRRPGAK